MYDFMVTRYVKIYGVLICNQIPLKVSYASTDISKITKSTKKLRFSLLVGDQVFLWPMCQQFVWWYIIYFTFFTLYVYVVSNYFFCLILNIYVDVQCNFNFRSFFPIYLVPNITTILFGILVTLWEKVRWKFTKFLIISFKVNILLFHDVLCSSYLFILYLVLKYQQCRFYTIRV